MEIRCVPQSQWKAALERVFEQCLSPADFREQTPITLAAAANNEIDLAGLIEARASNLDLLGIICGYPVPGRQSVVYPAYVTNTSDPRIATCLHGTLEDWLRAQNCVVAQSVLPRDKIRAAKQMRDVGYREIAELCYLYCPRSRFPLNEPVSELGFLSVSADCFDRLASVVQRTYVGSLDCPAIEPYREVRDVLSGYRHAGSFQSDQWRIITHRGQDIGCVLLGNHQSDQWELTYMGLVPEVRGRGWGQAIAHFALWWCGQRGGSQMVLAVDAENVPAIKMYSAVGFEEWARRDVFVKSLVAQRLPLADKDL